MEEVSPMKKEERLRLLLTPFLGPYVYWNINTCFYYAMKLLEYRWKYTKFGSVFRYIIFSRAKEFHQSVTVIPADLLFQTLFVLQMWHYVKRVQIRSFFWSVFSRIWTEYGPEKTPYLDNFHANVSRRMCKDGGTFF